MTDVVFFLKNVISDGIKRLPWPGPVHFVGLDPGPFRAPSGDPMTSSAFGSYWASLRDPSTGAVLPRLLSRFPDAGRVAFVGFSAAHGFMNPILNNDTDRARISAAVLIDSSFGGGKKGYVKGFADGAAGKMLMVSTTANTGGDVSIQPVWDEAIRITGKTPAAADVRPPTPAPQGGVLRLGKLAYKLRYIDAKGDSKPYMHTDQGNPRFVEAVLAGYLVPYWKGELSGGGFGSALLTAGVAAGAAAATAALLRKV